MDLELRVKQLTTLCPDIDLAVIRDFAARMDPEYFHQFPDQQITKHLHLINELTPNNPCSVKIQKLKAKSYDMIIVAYDYFSEFATFCGVLTAFGLDIREAAIYTYRDDPSPKPTANLRHPQARSTGWPRPRHTQLPGLSRKKVVDVIRVREMQGITFTSNDEIRLKEELVTLIQLLDTQQIKEVRRRINRRLTESLGRYKTPVSNLLHPVEIQFSNPTDSSETVMSLRSLDTPAFLYAFCNALTMRGIYIAKANVEVVGSMANNLFYVRGRQGRKIETHREQEELRVTATLIKEFTQFLSWAPDPAKALDHFDLFLDDLLKDSPSSSELPLLTDTPLLANLAQLFGTSDFLWEDFLRRQHANLLPIMEDYPKIPAVRSKPELAKILSTQLAKIKQPEARKTCLNQFKDQELFRIDMKHILGNILLLEFSCALTNLAEVILNQALNEAQAIVDRHHKRPLLANGHPLPFTICGLGKLGGSELGYASDIEVMFVYETDTKTINAKGINPSEYGERLVQEFLRWIEAKQEGIFRIDIRLRPHGEKGLLANSLEEIREYYSPTGQAAPFERQALIKLRHVAGDASLGQLVEQHRNTFVYSGEPWPLEIALSLRERQINELVSSGTTHVKYGPGGLIDAEYAVQYLQVMHGHQTPDLQVPNTLQALEGLRKHEILSASDSQTLKEDYMFLRRLIDALRIVRGNAQDLVLPDSGSDGMTFLARRLGFVTKEWKAGAAALEKEIHRRMNRTHQMFTKHFGKQKGKGKK